MIDYNRIIMELNEEKENCREKENAEKDKIPGKDLHGQIRGLFV